MAKEQLLFLQGADAGVWLDILAHKGASTMIKCMHEAELLDSDLGVGPPFSQDAETVGWVPASSNDTKYIINYSHRLQYVGVDKFTMEPVDGQPNT